MFEKKAFSIEEQINLLKKRGLEVQNLSKARKYLSHISYYRLGEYWYTMQEDKENHLFKKNSRFEDVVSLYNFDAELRSLIFGVLEKIEISLRTKLVYHLSHEFDPWWFQDASLFKNSLVFARTLSGLEEEITRSRSKDVTIKKHFRNYKDDGRFPPAWKTLEQTSFGTLSKIYGNLVHDIESKDAIAVDYGAVNHTYLPSWLQSLAQIRNFCAHHSRLWNRNLPGTVKLLPRPPYHWIKDTENVPKQHEFKHLYVHLCLMKYLLNIIFPGNSLTEDLVHLFNSYSNVDPNALGMKKGWEEEPLWKFSKNGGSI